LTWQRPQCSRSSGKTSRL